MSLKEPSSRPDMLVVMDEPDERRAPAGEPEADSAAAGLGPRVTAVFTAAEQAADHIVEMARAEAEDMRRRVEIEIDRYRREQRALSEAESREIVAAARAEADSIRTEARTEAEAIESAARTREQWTDEGIRLLVERAEWARRGLHEVVSTLSELAVLSPSEWRELPRTPLSRSRVEPERGERPVPETTPQTPEPAVEPVQPASETAEAAQLPPAAVETERPATAGPDQPSPAGLVFEASPSADELAQAEPAPADADQPEPATMESEHAEPAAERDEWRGWRTVRRD